MYFLPLNWKLDILCSVMAVFCTDIACRFQIQPTGFVQYLHNTYPKKTSPRQVPVSIIVFCTVQKWGFHTAINMTCGMHD